MSTRSISESRLELQMILKDICPNVYFSPPPNLQMKYPAIRYSRKDIQETHADDISYQQWPAYELIFISSNPDESILDEILRLPMASYDRHYSQDNLSHDVFTIYYK